MKDTLPVQRFPPGTTVREVKVRLDGSEVGFDCELVALAFAACRCAVSASTAAAASTRPCGFPPARFPTGTSGSAVPTTPTASSAPMARSSRTASTPSPDVHISARRSATGPCAGLVGAPGPAAARRGPRRLRRRDRGGGDPAGLAKACGRSLAAPACRPTGRSSAKLRLSNGNSVLRSHRRCLDRFLDTAISRPHIRCLCGHFFVDRACTSSSALSCASSFTSLCVSTRTQCFLAWSSRPPQASRSRSSSGGWKGVSGTSPRPRLSASASLP
jgi:hypothetical protein